VPEQFNMLGAGRGGGFYRLRAAHLAGAVAGLNGLIAGAEGLQI
jgi:hypothetical protein